MKRLIAALTALVLGAAPALAEPIPLDDISAFINRLETVQGRFMQLNDDGTRSTGTIYLHRPGRARFEYDPPEAALVLAGGGTVAIFDGRSNSSHADKYPLRRTPLNLLLERDIDLMSDDMVVGHFGDEAVTYVVAQDPQAPENGSIELAFRGDPVRLAEWTVIDGSGQRTRVVLTELRAGMRLSPRLFSISMEEEARGG